jgi:hypothetical protein
MAIGLAQEGSTREKLRAGYVQLEAFVTDSEFEVVRELQGRPGEEATLLRNGPSLQVLRQMAARAGQADTPAVAILIRISEQMLARKRELWGDC